MLNRITAAEGLPDGSVKPGEGFVYSLVPDLERTAGTEAEGKRDGESPKRMCRCVNVQMKAQGFLI